jgi:hypothetical protein
MFHEVEKGFLKNLSISMSLCGVMQRVVRTQNTKFRLSVSKC